MWHVDKQWEVLADYLLGGLSYELFALLTKASRAHLGLQ